VSGRSDRQRERSQLARVERGSTRGRARTILGLTVAVLALSVASWWRRNTSIGAAEVASNPAERVTTQESGSVPVAETVDARPADIELPPEGDLFELLAWLEPGGRGPVAELVDDGERFGRLFSARHPERWIEAGPYRKKLREPWIDGATLALEPGTWQLDGLDPPGVPLPEDATLAGAGMSTTLVVLGTLRPAGNVARFTLRDCTVFTDNRPLLDLEEGYAGLTFERVRFVGWDSGVGSAPLIRARGLALRMVGCEVLGGYGRDPGSGTLFQVPSAALLARLERCRFVATRTGIDSWHARASVSFVECAASDTTDRPAELVGDRAGVHLHGSVFRPLIEGARAPHLELDELFPRWRERLE